jgi:tRNA A-37 threonylcarbamoyl transferase component Bud32
MIESRFNISGKKGKEGTTFIATGRSGARYAIKMFGVNKAPAMISKEAAFQKRAADYGVSPRVLAVNLSQKYIIMERMRETIVDVMKRLYPDPAPSRPLSKAYQQRIIEICERLDEAGVVQNDGNPLNLMVDDAGVLFVIDFGFAKEINRKVLKKRGSEPNINLTLWHFQSQLKHYRIQAPLCTRRVDAYMKAFKAGKK